MVKHEIKVEILKTEEIKSLIENAYFKEGDRGKIIGKKHFLEIKEDDDINYTIFKGLDGATVKVLNSDIIDGNMRFLVDETKGDIRLYPISIYAIVENDKYIFY
jgi:hypothetical protein